MARDERFQQHKDDLSLKEGLAWKGTKLYVPASQQTLILQRSHDTKAAGHFRFVKTLHLVKRKFWWPKMKKDIEAY